MTHLRHGKSLRPILLWLIGIPIPIILLIWIFGGHHYIAVLIQFIVLKREGKWVIKSKDLERVFSVQWEAVDVAIRFANDSGKEGKPGVVLLQESKTKFEKVWTYGQNPYPPARSDLPIVSRTPEPEKLAGTLG